MKTNKKSRPVFKSSMRAIVAVLSLFFAAVFFSGCKDLTIKPRVIKHGKSDTNGEARGVAAMGIYAYVADGYEGLKILNIFHPSSVNQTGNVNLSGFNARVAVEKDIAVLTDTTQNAIYVVDISDKFNPKLKWTFKTLDIARDVAMQGGVAFLAERGNNPQASSYFSGIEAVSCSLTSAPKSLKNIPLKDMADVAATSSHVYAVSPNSLTVLARSTAGFNTPAVSTLNFSSSENIQSIDSQLGNLLYVLGQSLYLVDVSNPSKPSIADKKPVKGYAGNRVISSAGIPASSTPKSSQFPILVRFAYSTLKEYGIGITDIVSKKIFFLFQAVDVDDASEGRVKVYDIDMRIDFEKYFSAKDIIAVGALDNYGLGFAY